MIGRIVLRLGKGSLAHLRGVGVCCSRNHLGEESHLLSRVSA